MSLDAITEAVTRQRQAIADRDTAMAAAREAGATWRAIAIAADMTENGVRRALRLQADNLATRDDGR